MYWNSFAEFLAMGRHGVYVWGSFGVMAIVMIVEPLMVMQSQKSLVERLRRQLRAEKAEKRAEKQAERANHLPKGKQ